MRINFSKTTKCLTAIGSAVGLLSSSAMSQPVKPNLIYIMADDLGYGEVGAFGQKELKTPNLDKMALEGMKLTQFYTGTPVCAPSRSNLMQGMHNAHCRVRNNDVDYLRTNDVTMAEVLKYAGYRTGGFGKWGLSFNNQRQSWPTRQGFDHFFGYLDQRHAHNFWPTFLMDDGERLELDNVVPNEGRYGQGNATVEKDYSHELIVKRALKFVRDNKDTTFFMYVPFTVPHLNNEGAGSRDRGYEIPPGAIKPYENKPWNYDKKCYASMITLMDTDIGRIMNLLVELGIDSNTLVMFTSDNGSTWIKGSNDGNTNIIGEWFNGNGPFRGLKSDMWEGGIREPTIVRWPGVVPAGTTSDVIGSFPDVMPTFAEFAGVNVPKTCDGISLAPTILGYPGNQTQREYVYWYYPFRNQRAVRMGKYKGVWVNGKFTLHDLEKDTLERNNLASQYPDLVNQMKAINTKEGGNIRAVAADWDPKILTPIVRKGCMDSLYKEYDSLATVHDQSQCLTLVTSILNKNQFSSPLTNSTVNKSNLNFNLPNAGLYKLCIHNFLGKEILSTGWRYGKAGSNQFSIRKINLSKGVYFLTLRLKEGENRSKEIKNKIYYLE